MGQKQYAYFSAAIRDGALMTLKGSRYTLLDERGRTCAVGAGAMAIGLPTMKRGYECPSPFLPTLATLGALRKIYPYLHSRARCPACGSPHDLLNVAADLFDVLDWGREQIADWLYAEEEKLGFVTLTEEAEPLKPNNDCRIRDSESHVPSSALIRRS